jgi:hypothetical protein
MKENHKGIKRESNRIKRLKTNVEENQKRLTREKRMKKLKKNQKRIKKASTYSKEQSQNQKETKNHNKKESQQFAFSRNSFSALFFFFFFAHLPDKLQSIFFSLLLHSLKKQISKQNVPFLLVNLSQCAPISNPTCFPAKTVVGCCSPRRSTKTDPT